MPITVESLTKRQLEVYTLDRQGLKPSKIAKMTGLSLSRVSGLKMQLRNLGFDTCQFRREISPLRGQPAAAKRRKPVSADDVLKDIDIARSEHEPEDDELPDADEPAMEVERCSCGLILPCCHTAIQTVAWQRPETTYPEPCIDDSLGRRARLGNSRSGSRRKKDCATGAHTTGQSTT